MPRSFNCALASEVLGEGEGVEASEWKIEESFIVDERETKNAQIYEPRDAEQQWRTVVRGKTHNCADEILWWKENHESFVREMGNTRTFLSPSNGCP